METITRHSRNMLTVIVGLLLLFSLSCSDDPSSPKKEDEDPIPQDVVTIGVEGGNVVKGDLTISIPAGAFSEDHNVSVSEVEDDGAFGANTVSKSFKINGLPETHNKTIKIKTKYTGDLSGESNLAIGKMSYDVVSEDSAIVYEFFSASDSAGQIISLIPASSSQLFFSKKSADEGKDIFAKFFTSYSSTETENFTFYFPTNANPQAITKLGVIFERAFTINNEGLKMPLVDEERTVNIVESKSESPLTYSRKSKVTTYNIPLISVNNEQYDKLQVAAQIYLFFRSCDYNLHWMTNSISYWLKDLVSDSPDYLYPAETFLENAMEPFNGFGLKEVSKLKDHALGISGIIKYLTKLETFGLEGVGSLYKENSNEDKATLLLNNSGSQISNWWPDFFKKYVSNELFELPNDYFIEKAHAEWVINSEEDISKNYTFTYQDLSAKMFKISLNYSDLGDKQNLKFKMISPGDNKDLSLILFSIKNNKLQHIQTTQLTEYEIINPKSYFENGTGQFLAVLVNSNITRDDYLGQSEITLEISVSQKEKTILDYKNCFISCSLWGKYENKWADGSLHYWEEPFGISSINFIPGEFIGNEFKGESTVTGYWPSAPNSVIKYSITAELNKTHDLISSFEFVKVTTFNNDAKGIRTEKIIGGNIPLYPDRNDLFKIIGLDVCNNEITYFYEDLFYSIDGSENYVKILEVGCTEESKLELYFSE